MTINIKEIVKNIINEGVEIEAKGEKKFFDKVTKTQTFKNKNVIDAAKDIKVIDRKKERHGYSDAESKAVYEDKLLDALFNALDEEDQKAFLEDIQTEEGYNELLDFALENIDDITESVQINELSKKTLKSYVKKASTDELNSIKKADHYNKKNKEHPEPRMNIIGNSKESYWNDKAFKRFKGIQVANNKMQKESVQIDEANKDFRKKNPLKIVTKNSESKRLQKVRTQTDKLEED